jgi:anthranilate phosphoribosyltransferase
MEEIMNGEATPAQIGAFVTALRLKGETADEIAGFARTMRAKVNRVEVGEPVTDVVGTGGDNANTFNISTAAAFVAAGAGMKIAKHGNRAMSSHCGSADVLEALGVKIDLNAKQAAKCITEVGIGFMFAPMFHPAMKFAAAPRREIGIRTVFNILGPLTNPAGAANLLLGVADSSLVEKMAKVLRDLGCDHALVVHGNDGLDEITVTEETQVCEINQGKLESYSVSPEEFGLSRAYLANLKGGTADENAIYLRQILSGGSSARTDAVLLNAAAALYAGNMAATLKEGLQMARNTVESGAALKKLERLINFSQSLQ